MSPIIIANWKMNNSLKESEEFCQKISSTNYINNLIIAPPAPYLAYLVRDFADLNFCAQDVSIFDVNGAYTGEYSANMLKSCGVKYCLIGHNERRVLFNESNEIIIRKYQNAIDADLFPIICVGEPLESQYNNYKDHILSQLNFIKDFSSDLIIAYEPAWSIGTQNTPDPERLKHTFEALHNFCKQKSVANKVRLIYGGSVDSNNVKQILSISNIGGVLIGKASIDYTSLMKILDKLYSQ